MIRTIFKSYLTLLSIFIVFIIGCSQNDSPPLYERHSPYNFEDTLLNLDIAISEHNYRIIHRSNIGQAIRDRGDDKFPLSTIINFCNITYAKEMMEINPSLINAMPCYISVREQEEHVIVSTNLMNIYSSDQRQNNFAKRINGNLESIIEATIE